MHYTTRFSPETIRTAMVAELRGETSVTQISRKYVVSRRTVYRWLRRLGVEARSSRPKRQPRKSLPTLEERVRLLRQETRMGPLRLSWELRIPASTVYKILVRLGINKLAPLSEIPPAGRRYEGNLVTHVSRTGTTTASGRACAESHVHVRRSEA